MPSKKTKQQIKTQVSELPCLPLTLTFVSVLKDLTRGNLEGIEEIGGVKTSDLKDRVTFTLTVERLKGFQYLPEFTSLLSFPGAALYKSEAVYVSTEKSDVPVKTTLSALTGGPTLITFMFNNAAKLYLTAVEQKLKSSFQDRNFTEICGAFISKDPTKVVGSSEIVKYAKTDIKEISDMNRAQQEEIYDQSPLRSLKSQILALPGMEQKTLNFLKAEQQRKAAKKLLKYTI